MKKSFFIYSNQSATVSEEKPETPLVNITLNTIESYPEGGPFPETGISDIDAFA